MKRIRLITAAILLLCLFLPSFGSSEFLFSDNRFKDELTTENLDAIIDEYELFDGWYWTTRANVDQTFHGHPECPGWTTSAENMRRKGYLKGWYGCRWPINRVMLTSPEKGGYAECFAFAQFIGYLLSGEVNPQHNWDFYYSIEAAGGLRVGDIVRVEYRKNKREFHHSAVVYAVNGDEVLFLQVSGGNYNQISIGRGFTDGNVEDLVNPDEIAAIPGLKVSRYHKPSGEKKK